MKTLLKTTTLITSLIFSVITSADENKNLDYGFVLGVAFGGDTLVNLTFDDGSSEKLTAGDSIFFGGSVVSKLSFDTAYPLFAEVGLNYMTKSISAENGSISFTRIPLDLFINVKKDQFSIGTGLTYHLSPEIEGDGLLAGLVKYDNALGTVLKATYTLKRPNGKNGITWGLRYTSITYSGYGLYDQDGSNIAFTMGTGF